jgi:hypothetical protein
MTKNLIYITIIILLSILLVNQCRKTTSIKKTNAHNQIALLDSISFYKNKLGIEVAEKLAFKGTANELKIIVETKKAENQQLKTALESFKKVDNANSVNQSIKIDSVDIPFDKKLSVNFVRKFLKQTDFYTFSGEVNQLGININFLSNNLQTSVTGVKSIGWLSSEYRTEISNSNPYISTNNFDSFSFQPKKKRFGLGVFSGYAITSEFKPTLAIGLGFTYNFLSF